MNFDEKLYLYILPQDCEKVNRNKNVNRVHFCLEKNSFIRYTLYLKMMN